ncbi:MAG: CehA/McbA family metallohydrolase [Pirellulaceae bacterium]
MRKTSMTAALPLALLMVALAAGQEATLRGRIVDSRTQTPLAARLYVQSDDGTWYFAKSSSSEGAAVAYDKMRGESIERHTAVSAHPFQVDLPSGKYTLTVERGKEYLPEVREVEIGDKPVDVTIPLRRWISMSALGWYSGETHVHRQVSELPTAMSADDLNVALPLTYWVTQAFTPPTSGDKNSPPAKAELIHIDPTHVIYPMNTEYEIFTVDGKRHTLGAIFALGHKRVLDRGAPPIGPIARQVHDEGGLLELDKHAWPWSMMLVATAEVDLYELTNNHLWRTDFHFRHFNEQYAAPQMNVEIDENGMTERGWIDFTFNNYYTLLNCGFRLRPTAGTASGVHPVPLGFGRVYVYTGDDFSYEAWMKGLDAGRSFVTTGPLLDVRLNGRLPGETFMQPGESRDYKFTGLAYSERPLSKIEIVAEGRVLRTLEPANMPRESGGYESAVEATIPVGSSTWFCLRCWAPTAEGRPRFAHTAPWHVDVADRPLRARPEEIEYLIRRNQDELERHEGVLPKAALDEYRRAIEKYRQAAKAVE